MQLFLLTLPIVCVMANVHDTDHSLGSCSLETPDCGSKTDELELAAVDMTWPRENITAAIMYQL